MDGAGPLENAIVRSGGYLSGASLFTQSHRPTRPTFHLCRNWGGRFFKPMSLADFAPILIQLILAVGLASGILLASHLLGQRSAKNRIKDSAYECGIPSEGRTHTRFSVKFYVTAMLFILFDIEVVFLIPWVIVHREFLQAGIPILLPVLFFLGVLILGLFYEVRKGALDWEK